MRQLRELEDTTVRWTSELSRERYALELKLADVLLPLEERTPARSRRQHGASPPLVPTSCDWRARCDSRWQRRPCPGRLRGRRERTHARRSRTTSRIGPRGTLVLELDPALQAQVPSGSVLFVTVRESGVERGAPAAVKRVAATTFPMVVSIDERDSMAGAALPSEMRIEARLDADGNPLTRSPSEPSARVDRVKAGTSRVRLVLTR